MLLHYLVKQGNAKVAFSLKCCISALPEFNQLLLVSDIAIFVLKRDVKLQLTNQLLDFFNLLESRLMLTLLYDYGTYKVL